jgi:pantoate--beta-alanine ligase
MYPGELDSQTYVLVPELGAEYCGQNRPDHFQGVTTVVSRLFNMVLPDVAVFGKKDYQQLAIIRKMVADLAFPIEVVGVDTVRNEQGLALSSRNGYLSSSELKKASKINKLLNSIKADIEAGERNYRAMEKAATEALASYGFEPHYFNVCRQADLKAANKSDKALVILAAAVVGGKARLLDNIEIDLS